MRSHHAIFLLGIAALTAARATEVQTGAVNAFSQNDVFHKITGGERDGSAMYQNFVLGFPAAGGALTLSFLGNPVDRGRPGTRYRAEANSVTSRSLQVAPSTILNPPQDKWADGNTSMAGTPIARYGHSSVWTGSKMIVWGGTTGYNYGTNEYIYTNTGGVFDPVANSWSATTVSGAPSPRNGASTVWTGSKMVVWGGMIWSPVSQATNTGGQYDPSNDSWTATTTTGAAPPLEWGATVWTGSKMIVWGGNGDPTSGGYYSNNGGIYDPSNDSWTRTTTTNAPSNRIGHVGVWTGSKLVVWGGYEGTFNYTNTGGVYDPSNDSWTATSTTGTPPGLYAAVAFWTGSKMLVWGGTPDGWTNTENTGGLYDPGGNSWSATTTTNAPLDREGESAVWTGSRMVIWGGYSFSNYAYTDTGGQYDPVNDIWYGMATQGAPSMRANQSVVQFGNGELLLWGGTLYHPGDDPTYSNDGAYYFP
jgi:N-acetylneuraminic acid mutarotase